MYEQLDLFSVMNERKDKEAIRYSRLKVGDKIGKLILGEVLTATITKVEGNDKYWFYRTDKGILF